MLQNFDTPTDMTGGSTVTVRTEQPSLTEDVTVRLQPSASRAYLAKEPSRWGWDDLRDYVVASIEDRTGPFPRSSKKEAGIFKAFLTRWGAQAAPIARHAFEVCDGRWNGEPIGITRFCKGSDPYFAEVIASRLT